MTLWDDFVYVCVSVRANTWSWKELFRLWDQSVPFLICTPVPTSQTIIVGFDALLATHTEILGQSWISKKDNPSNRARGNRFVNECIETCVILGKSFNLSSSLCPKFLPALTASHL